MLEPNEENMLFTLNFFVLNVKVRMKGTERKTCRAGKGQLSDPQNKLETFSFLEGGAKPSPKEKKISRVYSRVREPFLALQDIIFFIF